MSTKTLNVTWDDHLQNLSGLFQDLYENKKLCDVTLYCSGGTLLKAHKIVLSACSPYFSKIFQEIDIKHPVIILKGVTYDEMHQLLEFMYKGSINILEQDLACLIQAGSYLEIKGMNAKNIPNNMKGSLKRTCEDPTDPLVEKTAKKPKDDLTRVAEQARVVSRESSPASATGAVVAGGASSSSSTPSSRRETRFKGQKRVDVKFKSTLGTSSPVNTGGGGGGATQRRKETDEADGADDKSTKGKSYKKTTNASIKVETKSCFNKNKNTPDKKPIAVQSDVHVPPEKEKDKDKDKDKERDEIKETEENGSVSNLVIKDVYSTGEETMKELHENEDDEGDYDDVEDEELEDENLVFPDVSFREADGEIVTQSDDEAIQRSSHLARHRRKHIGDRPYECKTCGKAFSRSDKLRTHCRQAHDDDYKPPPHLKKKYEFIEFTGDLLEKKGRGRPRKFPLRDPPPRPSLDGQKRGRGRPRKMSCPAPGEPVENYDITNLPFGDFSYLTEAIAMQAQEPEATYHDISIIPVSTCLTSAQQQQQHQQPQQQQQQQQINTDGNILNTSITNTTTINTTKTQENIQIVKTSEEDGKSNDLISNIRQIGECTIQPVNK